MSVAASWDHIATFLAVMREGSLSGAARAQGVTQPTVRRQIEDLERDLGTTLFARTPNGLIPTPAARVMLPYADSMRSSAEALARAARSEAERPTGTVRVTCSEIVAVEVIPPILCPLVADHPALSLEIAATDRNEDILRREADVAVRMVRPVQSALVARFVGDIKVGLFAHRDCFQGRAVPTGLDEFGTGHLVIGGDRQDLIGPALVEAGIMPSAFRVAIGSENSLVQLAALRAGVGIGVCQIGIAARDPNLVAVLPALTRSLPIWIVTHEDIRNQPRVRVVFDRLVEGLSAYVGSQDATAEKRFRSMETEPE